ncbi:hypothetical protein E8E14_000032 [Neopestalotiopsis sp. 37M]|nr:hypothetical protein E8E14_000032 [Neopestalotiopsis sp. 37M]
MDELTLKARDLLQRCTESHDAVYGIGSMSYAPYDTAWVSMVTKIVDGEKKWLFPECFQFLLTKQATDGSWGADTGHQADGILNTAAGLLSLKRHRANPLQIQGVDSNDLRARINKATESLRAQLAIWHVASTTHVGFELLVPKMLQLLAEEDSSLIFDFEGEPELLKLNRLKLSLFNPEVFYGTSETPALHSSEAFIGEIDYDRIGHHAVLGSMMGSPSSTAAYLMHASQWDLEAEAYLGHVVKVAGRGDGGVPSAYPSTNFEYSWILSTLLRAGFTAAELECSGLGIMKDTLSQAFHAGKGVIGFASQFGADADDTAKGIVALSLLDQPTSPVSLVRQFETGDHFRTYPFERDPSLSANCNVLLALIQQEDMKSYEPQILKVVNFLCHCWWNSDDKISDKWNSSNLYPSLLLVEALVGVLEAIELGHLSQGILDGELKQKVAIVLFQACFRVVLGQESNGAWNGSSEETAYSVLLLCEVRKVSFFEEVRESMEAAITHGADFIRSCDKQDPNYVWIEKVTYSSQTLTEAYTLASLKAASTSTKQTICVGLCASLHADSVRLNQLFKQTPLFSTVPEWEMKASMVEASLFQPLLRRQRLSIYPRKDMEEDKYFDIIPLTWTSCNNRSRTFAATAFLYDMMTVSFLNYQSDEFMEAVAGDRYRNSTHDLRRLIDTLFTERQVRNGSHGQIRSFDQSQKSDLSLVNTKATNGNDGKQGTTWEVLPEKTDFIKHREVREPLKNFVAHVLTHPSVLTASIFDQQALKKELKIFLLAHVSQVEDNILFSQQQDKGYYTKASDSFFKWVRTTSADHTSCPYSFYFVSCLLSSSIARGGDCFPTVMAKYFAEDACRHLATMCRMYNDYGSVARDRREGNLNSVDFPEFRDSLSDQSSDTAKKTALLQTAEYERGCLTEALRRLSLEGDTEGGDKTKSVHQRIMEILYMFCDVTDLYGQIYVVRDIASRMKHGAVTNT